MGLAAPTGERLGYEGKGTGGNFGVIKVISLMGDRVMSVINVSEIGSEIGSDACVGTNGRLGILGVMTLMVDRH